MARKNGIFTDRQIQALKAPGYHAVGDGLYLQISPAMTKSWIFRYTIDGKRREMGLRAYPEVTLGEARETVRTLRAQVRTGIDPIEQRAAEKREKRLQQATLSTFEQCAAAYITAHRASWKSTKHGDQWANTLATYAYPVIGNLPVSKIDTGLVLQIIEPLWSLKTETGSRVRGRIESVLDWATVRGYRAGDNPARWRGHLDHLLPKRTKVKKVAHHAALPYSSVGEFMTGLRAENGNAALALEFTILTAVRTGETIGAMWDELDIEARVWTIPAGRMKAEQEHRVPLSEAAVEVLRIMKTRREIDNPYVFPGQRPKRPLSNMAMLTLLQTRMKHTGVTVHGFRSTFRDWAAERTQHASDVIEMALAHTIRNKTEAAYRRGDLFEKRAVLMAQWSDFCSRVAKPAEVKTLQKPIAAAA